MSYATIEDVTRRYPPILTSIGSGEAYVSSVEVASVYIADAESYVNAYLRSRYTTPLASEPIVTQVTADIAIYKILEGRFPRLPEQVTARWTSANSTLAMLKDGALLLDPAAQTAVTSGSDQWAWSNVEDYAGPIFQTAEVETNCRSLFEPFGSLDRF